MVLLGLLVFSVCPLFAADPVAKLQVLPQSIDFGEVEAYSTEVATEDIIISNCGDPDSVLCWGITSNDCWICVVGDTIQGEINLPDGDERYEYVTMCASGLCIDEVEHEGIVGLYEGAFRVHQYDYDYSATEPECKWGVVDPDADPEFIEIEATMTISEFNVLEVYTDDPDNPHKLDFGTDDDEKELYIKNAGEGEMEWEAVVSEGADWLTINDGTTVSGTNVSGGSCEITVKVDRSKVEGCATKYSASIKVTSTNASPSEAIVSAIMEKVLETPSPSYPTPANGSTEQSLYTTLEWWEGKSVENVGGIVYFDVYFSTNQALVDSYSPSVLVCEDLKVPYCDPSEGGGPLDAQSTYYWKVKAVDECQGGDSFTSDTWSFTTGTESSPCLASVALHLNDEGVNLLRGFRDEVLVRSLDGERYINLYYSPHTIEVLLILLFNPELRMCANRIVKESLPAIQSLLRGERAVINAELIADIEFFLREFEKDTSPGLKRDISIIREDIATGYLFKSFGFSAVK